MKLIYLITLMLTVSCAGTRKYSDRSIASEDQSPKRNIEIEWAQENDLRPCGLTGSIEERIADCDTEARGFNLVLRTDEFKEVYYWAEKKQFWTTDVVINNQILIGHKEFVEYCKNTAAKVYADLGNIKWEVPSTIQMKSAFANGLGYFQVGSSQKVDFISTFYTTNPKRVYYVLWDKGILPDGRSHGRCIGKKINR